MGDLVGARDWDIAATQDVCEKRPDVGEALRTAERDEEDGVERM